MARLFASTSHFRNSINKVKKKELPLQSNWVLVFSVHTHVLTLRYTPYALPQTRGGLTDGAVLPVPALVALTLPVLAGSVFDAERVADALVAGRTGPAFLAAAGATHTHAVGPTVHRAHL